MLVDVPRDYPHTNQRDFALMQLVSGHLPCLIRISCSATRVSSTFMQKERILPHPFLPIDRLLSSSPATRHPGFPADRRCDVGTVSSDRALQWSMILGLLERGRLDRLLREKEATNGANEAIEFAEIDERTGRSWHCYNRNKKLYY